MCIHIEYIICIYTYQLHAFKHTVIISSLKSDVECVGRDKNKKGYLFIVKISNAQ